MACGGIGFHARSPGESTRWSVRGGGCRPARPTTDPRGVLIDVAASGIAFPDVLLTRGLYQLKPALPFVPGAEVAGTVVSAPEGSGFAAGDRVAAFPGYGGFAEQVSVPAPFVFPLPDRSRSRPGPRCR